MRREPRSRARWRRTDERANPGADRRRDHRVPRSRSSDPDLGLLDDIVRVVGATPQDRPWLGLRPILLPRRTLLIIATALLIATMGAIAVGSRFLQPDLISGQMWPQTSLEEVREAQERADAGDPDYTWQVDPELVGDAEPWTGRRSSSGSSARSSGGRSSRPVGGYAYGKREVSTTASCSSAARRAGRTRCRARPDMPPEVRGCAPTIDDFRYETVRFTVEQPARRGPSGIWVVTRWEMLQPVEPHSASTTSTPSSPEAGRAGRPALRRGSHRAPARRSSEPGWMVKGPRSTCSATRRRAAVDGRGGAAPVRHDRRGPLRAIRDRARAGPRIGPPAGSSSRSGCSPRTGPWSSSPSSSSARRTGASGSCTGPTGDHGSRPPRTGRPCPCRTASSTAR